MGFFFFYSSEKYELERVKSQYNIWRNIKMIENNDFVTTNPENIKVYICVK